MAVASTLRGHVIAGRFRIEAPLGEGGMAEVFRAHDLALNRAIALKLLKPTVAEDPQAVLRLRREGEVLSSLAHPAIVRVETYGKLDDGRLFIAMELLEGETLGQRMRTRGRLPATELTPIVTGAAAGLAAAHRQQIIHRDLKPDNIFLSGEPVQVKLLDFGISKVFGLAKLTRTGQILGTPRYMAPEQLSDSEDVDQRIDVYALGVMLYEALAGTPPFVGASPTALLTAILRGDAVPLRTYCPQLDPAIEEVVMRAMARSREARFPSPLDLAEAWVDAAGGPRRGAATNLLGGSGKATRALGGSDLGASDSPVLGAQADAPIRPGTFPAMAERAEYRKTRPSRPAPAAGQNAQAAASPAAAPLPASQAATVQPAAAAPAPVQPTATPVHAAPVDETAVLPKQRGGPWVLVLALLGGAATAAGALKLMDHFESTDETPAPSETAPAGATPGTSSNEEGQAPSEPPAEPAPNAGAASDEEAIPLGAEPEEASEPAPMNAAARETRMRAPARRPRGATLSDAREALRVGNTPRCLEILGRLGSRSSGALFLEAECHQRGGDRAAALRNYERYCRVFPGGPAIGEVRSRVARLGGRCE
ncbi:MAG: serine/threonine-protein kinase [Myxococcota bacterium]